MYLCKFLRFLRRRLDSGWVWVVGQWQRIFHSRLHSSQTPKTFCFRRNFLKLKLRLNSDDNIRNNPQLSLCMHDIVTYSIILSSWKLENLHFFFQKTIFQFCFKIVYILTEQKITNLSIFFWPRRVPQDESEHLLKIFAQSFVIEIKAKKI